MSETVTDYHPTVMQTSSTMDGLIAGTSCFPGGTGLWRGSADGGELPEYFPENSVMFVAHNFDGIRGFDLSFSRRGEAGGQFWQRLLILVAGPGLSPTHCFFTNALMGLKPGKAEGTMPSVRGYKEQCRHFLKHQVDIVQPRAVIALGVKAKVYVDALLDRPCLTLRHPKDWYFRELVTRSERLQAESQKLRTVISQSQTSP